VNKGVEKLLYEQEAKQEQIFGIKSLYQCIFCARVTHDFMDAYNHALTHKPNKNEEDDCNG
jgi:hypothetical protein